MAAITEGVDCDGDDVDVVRRQETARRDSGSNGLSSNPGNMGELYTDRVIGFEINFNMERRYFRVVSLGSACFDFGQLVRMVN